MIYVFGHTRDHSSISYDTSPLAKSRKKHPNVDKLIDPCETCGLAEITECCNKCGDGVCSNHDKCCMVFPHYRDTTYVVCMRCVGIIDEKLIPLIDLGKLRLLKRQISEGSSPRRREGLEDLCRQYHQAIRQWIFVQIKFFRYKLPFTLLRYCVLQMHR